MDKPDLPKHYSITLTMGTIAWDDEEAMENITQEINFALGAEWDDIKTVTDADESDVMDYLIDHDADDEEVEAAEAWFAHLENEASE